jgi:glucose/mannose-6-phosphate isomerase
MKILDDPARLRAGDASDMGRSIEGLPGQLEEGLAIGRDAPLGVSGEGVSSIVLFGMGGSAIGGEILRGCLEDRLAVPFEVVRGYSAPAYVGPGTLAVVSSYSGDTEEALAAYREAAARDARILCSTTGGRLAEEAVQAGHDVVRIPPGLQPRAAVGYGLATLMVALWRLGLTGDPSDEIAGAVETARGAAREFGLESPTSSNPAKQLAEWLFGRVPVVYGVEPRTAPVASRWRTQFAENSKVWAHSAALPEIDHNEIVPLGERAAMARDKRVVFLRDEEDHPRVALRVEITARMLSEAGAGTREVASFGRSRLARVVSLVMLGDFTSLYLAALSGVDPTPITSIDALKRALSGPEDARSGPNGKDSQ